MSFYVSIQVYLHLIAAERLKWCYLCNNSGFSSRPEFVLWKLTAAHLQRGGHKSDWVCFVHLHRRQQGELVTYPVQLLIWTTERPWILPPQWNIEPSGRIFPPSAVTLAMSLISRTEDSDSSGYYSRISKQLLALSVSNVLQGLCDIVSIPDLFIYSFFLSQLFPRTEIGAQGKLQ